MSERCASYLGKAAARRETRAVRVSGRTPCPFAHTHRELVRKGMQRQTPYNDKHTWFFSFSSFVLVLRKLQKKIAQKSDLSGERAVFTFRVTRYCVYTLPLPLPLSLSLSLQVMCTLRQILE